MPGIEENRIKLDHLNKQRLTESLWFTLRKTLSLLPIKLPLYIKGLTISSIRTSTFLVQPIAEKICFKGNSSKQKTYQVFNEISIYIKLSFYLFPATSFEKRECWSLRSTDGVLNSATLPSFITSTRSLSITVSSLCAIVSTVLSLNSSLIVSWIKASVFISTLAVASSIHNTYINIMKGTCTL